MSFVKWAETRAGQLTVWDLALVKWSCLAGGVYLGRVIPALSRVDSRVLVGITLALAVKPAISVLRPTDEAGR